jgi:hypothetical protein
MTDTVDSVPDPSGVVNQLHERASLSLEVGRLKKENERLRDEHAAMARSLASFARSLTAAQAALVMIRGVVAGVLEDEQMKGGEFA